MHEGLAQQRAEIRRLRRYLDDLLEDLEFSRNGGALFYAVDFSEIYDYLNYDVQRDAPVTHGFGSRDLKVSAAHASAALKHLFHNLTPTLYLLPSYQQELTAFARRQRIAGAAAQEEQNARLRELYERALELSRSFTEEERELLRAVSRGDSLSQEQQELTVKFLSEDFLFLSVAISNLLEQHKAARRLMTLIDSGKLSYNLDALLGNLGTFGLPGHSDEEETKLFTTFPRILQKRFPFAKLLDARALINLRDINLLLAKQRRRARLLLVTHDQSMRKAAEKLEGHLDSDNLIRSLDSVLFHGIISHMPDEGQRREWLEETTDLLDDQLAKLNDLDAELRRHDNPREKRRGATDLDRPYLMEQEENVIRTTLEQWNKHISIRINPLLGSDLPALPADNGEPTGGAQVRADATGQQVAGIDLGKFRDFWEFVSGPEYRRMAEVADSTIWDKIADQPFYLMFLTHLGKHGSDRVSKVMAEVFPREGGKSKTVLRTMMAALMPSVQFTSKKFERLLKKFTFEDIIREARLEKLRTPFFSVVSEITGGIREPENFLFLAYMLGILGLWEDALRMADRSDEMYGEKESAEVKFLKAFLTRRMAETEDDPAEKLRQFGRASELIDEAIRIKTPADDTGFDPRYLKEKGTIILFYYDGMPNFARHTGAQSDAPPDATPLGDVTRGKELLNQARGLIHNDIRLEMEIINNLAYMEVLSEPMDYDTARAYLSELKIKLKAARSEYEVYCNTILPFFRDTCVMVEARRAKDRHDTPALQECLKDLALILSEKNLTPEQINATESHVKLIIRWIKEAGAKSLQPST